MISTNTAILVIVIWGTITFLAGLFLGGIIAAKHYRERASELTNPDNRPYHEL